MTEKELIKRAKKNITKEEGVAWFRTGKDIFGIFDIVYIDGRGKVSLVQVTTIDHKWDHKQKISKWLQLTGIVPQRAYLMLWDYKINDFIIEPIQ